MSLRREGFELAASQLLKLNSRANELFKNLDLPLENKVQMDHYGSPYLFGKVICEETTDDELIQIIKSTPEKSWNGNISFFGKWIEPSK